jgi:hypothetical protein
MAKTKKELAELAIRLFSNIDQSDQWDNYNMTERCFEHVDKKFLLSIIDDLKSSVEANIRFGGKYLVDDEDVVQEALAQARKVLGEIDEL